MSKSKAAELESILGNHVSLCSSICNRLESQYNNTKKKIDENKCEINNIRLSVHKLKEPNDVAITSAKAEIKNIKQRLSGIDTDIMGINKNAKSLSGSVISLQNKVSQPQKVHVVKHTSSDKSQDCSADWLSLHTALIERVDEIESNFINKSAHTCSAEWVTEHRHFLTRLENTESDIDELFLRMLHHRGSSHGLVNTDVDDEAEGDDEEETDVEDDDDSTSSNDDDDDSTSSSSDASDVVDTNNNDPVADHHGVKEDNKHIPVLVSSHNRSRSSKVRSNGVRYYIGDIPADVSETTIKEYLVSKGVNIIYLSVKPNSRKDGFNGAKLHISESHSSIVESEVFWPRPSYIRKWIEYKQ